MELTTISNDGPRLVDTNYWDTEHAASGLVFLTYNAGAARLLVPPPQEGALADMRTASHVVATRGLLKPQRRDAVELLFEDGTDTPYVLTICVEQTDRVLPDSERGRRFPFLVYTRAGLAFETECRYRRAMFLPCLKPWR